MCGLRLISSVIARSLVGDVVDPGINILDEIIELDCYYMFRRLPVGNVHHLLLTTATSWCKLNGYCPIRRISCRDVKVSPAHERQHIERIGRGDKVVYAVRSLIESKKRYYSSAYGAK